MSSLAPASGNSQSAIIINAVRPIITIATKLSAYVASNQEQKVPSRTTPRVRISLIFVDKSLHPQLPQKLFLHSYNIFASSLTNKIYSADIKVGAVPATVVRRISRFSPVSLKGLTRCIHCRLSHITRSPDFHSWA